MKKHLLVTTFLAITCSLQAQVDLSNGLIGYYSLNGNGLDGSTAMNHGATHGGITTVPDRFGQPNSAMLFDGVDDYIQVSAFPIYYDNVTISLWVKASPSGSINYGLFHIADTNNDSGVGINLRDNSGADANTAYAGYRDQAWSTGNYPVSNTTAVTTDDTWHHLVFIYDALGGTFYIDGVAQSTLARNSNLYQETGTELQIGHLINQSPGNYHFAGSIDDVRVYNRAINTDEVDALYNEPASGLVENGNCASIYCDEETVGIGTDNIGHPGYKLFVKDGILTEQVTVKAEGQWPDYVFAEGYKPMSIEALAHYITEHKHLPDVPSQNEVWANGINLGEMDKSILKNVETLTLYLLQQNDQLKELKEQNQRLEKELQEIREMLTKKD